METGEEILPPARSGFRTWLFNPFHYVAGWEALIVGVAIMLAAAVVGSLSSTHFDGVLDCHSGAKAPVWFHVAEALIDWILLASFLLIGGMIASKSRVRALDVIGTQALARAPSLVAAVPMLLPGARRYSAHLAAGYLKNLPDVQTSPPDFIFFCAAVLVIIVMMIWMVVLMYKAFSVSCNVAGTRAAVAFVVSLLLGEALSKLAIIKIASGLAAPAG
jgi:hypothetical protein